MKFSSLKVVVEIAGSCTSEVVYGGAEQGVSAIIRDAFEKAKAKGKFKEIEERQKSREEGKS